MHITDNIRITVKLKIVACSMCETHTVLTDDLLLCWVYRFLEGRISVFKIARTKIDW